MKLQSAALLQMPFARFQVCVQFRVCTWVFILFQQEHGLLFLLRNALYGTLTHKLAQNRHLALPDQN
jgi:hypothetical protein